MRQAERIICDSSRLGDSDRINGILRTELLPRGEAVQLTHTFHNDHWWEIRLRADGPTCGHRHTSRRAARKAHPDIPKPPPHYIFYV